jgi:hypothetical protein
MRKEQIKLSSIEVWNIIEKLEEKYKNELIEYNQIYEEIRRNKIYLTNGYSDDVFLSDILEAEKYFASKIEGMEERVKQIDLILERISFAQKRWAEIKKECVYIVKDIISNLKSNINLVDYKIIDKEFFEKIEKLLE